MACSNPFLAGNFAPVTDETKITGLPVEGTLPPGLDGQYLRLGPNPARRPDEPYAWGGTDTMVHAVELRDGRAVAYRNRWILTPHVAGVLGLGPTTASVDSCERLVEAGGRLLAVSRSGVAYEVSEDLATRPVPVPDFGRDRCLADVAADHAHHPLLVESGDVLRTGHGLTRERGGSVEVLDVAPQGWSTGAPTSRVVHSLAIEGDRPFAGTMVYRHDLERGTRSSFDFGLGRHPGELTFVPDGDGGWLVGFVHDDGRGTDDLVVLDAQHLEDGPVATVRLPRRVPYGWHGHWRQR